MSLKALHDKLASDFPSVDPQESVRLVEYDHQAEIKVITALLYDVSFYPYDQLRERVSYMAQEEREKVLQEAAKNGSIYKALAHTHYTFDISLEETGIIVEQIRGAKIFQKNRCLATMSLADLQLFAKTGNKTSGLCYDKLEEVHPLLAKYIKPQRKE